MRLARWGWLAGVLLVAACGHAPASTQVPVSTQVPSTAPSGAGPVEPVAVPSVAVSAAPSPTPVPSVVPTPLPSIVPPVQGNPGGGLPRDEAAYASLEAQAPDAFVLTSSGPAFLTALAAAADGLRQRTAAAIAADAELMAGLDGWNGLDAAGRLALLGKAAAIEAKVSGITLPEIVQDDSTDLDPGVVAYFAAPDDEQGFGQIGIVKASLEDNQGYAALDAVVHETRHAAQYQLGLQAAKAPFAADDPRAVLVKAYDAAAQAVAAIGGENNLSYGDYAHLTIEFDALQMGNRVASIVSRGSLQTLGLGFVDAQYDAQGQPLFDLPAYAAQLAPADVVAAVNQGEYRLELAAGVIHPRDHRPIGSMFMRRWPRAAR